MLRVVETGIDIALADPAGPDDSEVKASPATRATPEETAVKNHGPKDGEQNDGNESEARLIEGEYNVPCVLTRHRGCSEGARRTLRCG